MAQRRLGCGADDAFVTQVIKTDAGRHVHLRHAARRLVGLRRAGRRPADARPQGREVDSELGGLMWVRAVDMGGATADQADGGATGKAD